MALVTVQRESSAGDCGDEQHGTLDGMVSARARTRRLPGVVQGGVHRSASSSDHGSVVHSRQSRCVIGFSIHV